MNNKITVQFDDLGDPGVAQVSLTKLGIGYILTLDRIEDDYVSIELSEEQVWEFIQSLENAMEKASNTQKDEKQILPDQIKYFEVESEDPMKVGFVLVTRFLHKIGLTLSLRKVADVESYFPITVCEELITVFTKALVS